VDLLVGQGRQDAVDAVGIRARVEGEGDDLARGLDRGPVGAAEAGWATAAADVAAAAAAAAGIGPPATSATARTGMAASARRRAVVTRSGRRVRSSARAPVMWSVLMMHFLQRSSIS
jgi:hypothetical protein